MADSGGQTPAIENKQELMSWLDSGAKPVSDWRIGTEHEKFCFYSENLEPVPYEGERGIRALLDGLAREFGWTPVMEGDNIIGLSMPDCPLGGNISLEPGGQFELSGAPLETVHETCDEVHRHLAQVRKIGEPLGIGFLGLGFSPKWRLDETPRMPKGRYKIMTAYMPKVGGQGLDMMYRTCTVQVNLDFADEADMVRKFRVGLALQPIATALFANSPFKEGTPNGFLSLRSEIWKDTDNDRTGMLPFVFDDGMGYERYVDYALAVPMYFVYRDGQYIDATGHTFQDFLEGRLSALPGQKPTLKDWTDHLTTLFPEVRLKQYLEMRGADGGPWRRLCALPALWVGLLYEKTALDAAWDLVKDWDAETRQNLRDNVPKLGLKTPLGPNKTVGDVALDVLEIAKNGLISRNKRDRKDVDETQYLTELLDIANLGQTPADRLLDQFENEWAQNIDPLFKEHVY